MTKSCQTDLYYRFIFAKLRKYVKEFLESKCVEPRMVGIAGIRGVGKTTLLWQVADFVEDKHKVDVYFLSMDITTNYGFDSRLFIEAMKDVIPPNKKIVLLFDETQYVENWSLVLKIIYDSFKNCFIIATGSSSLLIRSSVDLSARWNIESLYPLSFSEFVMIKSWLESDSKRTISPEKGLGNKIKDVLFYSDNIKQLAIRIDDIRDEINNYFQKIDKEMPLQGCFDEYIFYGARDQSRKSR